MRKTWNRWRSRLGILTASVVVFGVVLSAAWRAFDENGNNSLEWQDDETKAIGEAQAQLERRKYRAALETVRLVLDETPHHPTALLIAGEAATRLGELQSALEFYLRVQPANPTEYLQARFAAAEVERSGGSLAQSEQLYREVLEVNPNQEIAMGRLALILKLTGRDEEASTRLREIIQRGRFTIEQLQWLAASEQSLNAREFLEDCLRREPRQPYVYLGLAKQLRRRGETNAARSAAAKARELLPGDFAIESTWGDILLEQNAFDELVVWFQDLNDACLQSSEPWYVLGVGLQGNGETGSAIRCYLETLDRNPDHAPACHRLSQLLDGDDHPSLVEQLAKRSQLLNELQQVAASTNSGMPAQEACRKLVHLLEALDRTAEAIAWLHVSLQLHPLQGWEQPTQARLLDRLAAQERDDGRPFAAKLLPLKSEFPLPSRIDPAKASSGNAQIADGTPSRVTLIDRAAHLGLAFRYDESPDPETEGRRMFEFPGGGVAALDYDRDGRPDLYFTQGARWDHPVDTTLTDMLFRNMGQSGFQPKTPSAEIFEDRFSQGVAAGDWNNDGFPDLYVANIGSNRLFENQGDGTYIEVETEVLTQQSLWTTSCAIGDLNGDGIPDIYDANYLQGENVFSLICETSSGPRVCTPFAFPAAPDRLLVGTGDGALTDQSAISNVSAETGKGLGLLVGSFDGDPQLEVFIANDTVANTYWDLSSSSASSVPFHNAALVNGLAFSQDGEPQACMGVAAADFDGNQRLDLFVTNYFNESNALYLQNENGFFVDESRSHGIRALSLPLLGFGTQAGDVDLDGDFDLFLVNGDLDDFTDQGRPFRMPAQLLLNNGNGSFRAHMPSHPDDFVAPGSGHRGRSVCRLDWDRDGLLDFAISQLDEPAALVRNESIADGVFYRFELIGTESARTPIGTQVLLRF
ncbi:MAG: VCBS repeat-containing protein, partial [Planctomycetaceae bacterium]|nr:VCBS repeat-containing protein [Planctomycetaceae bacterium]